ncbi:MAG: peptide ABC transporter substrate-binding protein [Bdellovibrionaceae bacterium]|nr:peptide ABC transporter substrate-binding protein [Bdellovibrionales bacterium]MCB9086556.1 peptide ABC transporter substrate-binding protein [Pseudobdellovibrionaceae bacterium]
MVMGYMGRLLTLTMALALASCTSKKREVKMVAGLKYEETLIYNLTTEPPTLDWNKATDVASAIVIFNVMEPLLGFDLSENDLPLEPRLAVDWHAEKQGHQWVFELREGVKWSDGKEFEAQQVVDSLERLLQPETAASGASWFFEVVGAKDFNKGILKDFSQVGVKAEGKYQIRFTLNKPLAYFPKLLAIQNAIPIRKDLIAKYGDKWTEAENLATLGSYHLKEWKHDNYLVLEKNIGYFLTPPPIQNVLLRIINDESTGVNLFETGQIDIQPTIPAGELDRLKGKAEFKTSSEYSINFLGFNTKKEPFNNPDVRRAISMAIDRREIVQVLGGHVMGNRAWLPPDMLGYSDTFGMTFDPDKARILLGKTGYGRSKQFPKAVISYNTNSNHKLVIENIQAQLKKNLGIELEIQNQEWKSYLAQINSDAPHLFRMGWIALFPDPAPMFEVFRSDSEFNRFGWGGQEFNQLLDSAAAELKPEKRFEYYKRIQEILSVEEVPAFAVYSSSNKYLVSERTQGFPINPLDRVEFRRVKLK